MNRTGKYEYKKLIDVCEIQYGYPFDSSYFSSSSDDGLPLIRIRDVKEGYTNTYFKGDYPKEYVIHQGDFLVGMDGEFNIAPWRSGDALLNQRVCKLKSKRKDVLMRFLYRFLVKELKRIEEETPFVTVKHLSAKRLNQVFINIPSIAEQEHIVAELDLLQGIIDKQKAQLKEYNTLARSIFYDMFGDPVENGKGWSVKSLGDICADKKEIKRASKCFESFEDIFYIDISSINSHTNSLIGITPYVFDEAPSRAQQKVEKGDVLISLVRPNLKNIALVDLEENNLVASSGFCVLRASKPSNVFIKYLVLTPHFTEYLVKRVSGANYPAVREDDIKNCIIGVPPLQLQQQFAERIEAIEKQKAAINKSLEETQKLFDYTMDKYFG